MKVLIIGGGGREHALAWKAAQSSRVEWVYVAPGNAGTAQAHKITNVGIAATDIPGLLAFADDHAIDLTIVGPEQPLTMGIVDEFKQHKLPCFGPNRAGARLEGSKVFAKEFMQRHGIPTASSRVFYDYVSARDYIQAADRPLVIKADGLAAGKGVVVAEHSEQALTAARAMLEGGQFGEAGRQVVIEDRLLGQEVSFICMVDGQHILPMASSQDHKARDKGDLGPNTGGMGAYSPAPLVDPALHRKIMLEVMEPAVKGLVEEGMPYCGFLYAGLMISEPGDISVLEFNCRFGDPETQPILLRMQGDLVSLCQLALQQRLDQARLTWDDRTALAVVMAAEGYPGPYRKGEVITGLDELNSDTLHVFHAGTHLQDGQVVTHGGRVLAVTVLADDVGAARQLAYAGVDRIHWPGAFWRDDIGCKAL